MDEDTKASLSRAVIVPFPISKGKHPTPTTGPERVQMVVKNLRAHHAAVRKNIIAQAREKHAALQSAPIPTSPPASPNAYVHELDEISRLLRTRYVPGSKVASKSLPDYVPRALTMADVARREEEAKYLPPEIALASRTMTMIELYDGHARRVEERIKTNVCSAQAQAKRADNVKISTPAVHTGQAPPLRQPPTADPRRVRIQSPVERHGMGDRRASLPVQSTYAASCPPIAARTPPVTTLLKRRESEEYFSPVHKRRASDDFGAGFDVRNQVGRADTWRRGSVDHRRDTGDGYRDAYRDPRREALRSDSYRPGSTDPRGEAPRGDMYRPGSTDPRREAGDSYRDAARDLRRDAGDSYRDEARDPRRRR